MPRSTKIVLPPIRPLKNGKPLSRKRRKPYRFRGANANPVINGRKFCTRCGHYRLIIDFPAHRRHGNYVIPSNRCYACGRREQREMRKATWGKLGARARVRREYDRIWHEAKRREKGVPERWPHRESVSKRDPRLPADPIRDLILNWLDEPDSSEARRMGGPTGHDQLGTRSRSNLAVLTGLNKRTIWRILNENQETINLSNADAICVALDMPLSYVYSDHREAA